jgi:hypothetical protein
MTRRLAEPEVVLGGLSPAGLYRIKSEIGSVRIGRRTVYMRADLDAYLARHRQSPRRERL